MFRINIAVPGRLTPCHRNIPGPLLKHPEHPEILSAFDLKILKSCKSRFTFDLDLQNPTGCCATTRLHPICLPAKKSAKIRQIREIRVPGS